MASSHSVPALPATGPSLVSATTWHVLQSNLHLSAREVQIIQLVFDDQKEESIAYALNISRHTVNTYVQRLYSKLKIHSRTQLVLRVMSEALSIPVGTVSAQPGSGALSIVSPGYMTEQSGSCS